MTVSGVPSENFIFRSPGGHRMWYLKELAVCSETPPSSVPDGSQSGPPPVFPPLSRCPVCICFETFRSHWPGLVIWALPQNLSLGVSVCLVWLGLSSTALGHYSLVQEAHWEAASTFCSILAWSVPNHKDPQVRITEKKR